MPLLIHPKNLPEKFAIIIDPLAQLRVTRPKLDSTRETRRTRLDVRVPRHPLKTLTDDRLPFLGGGKVNEEPRPIRIRRILAHRNT